VKTTSSLSATETHNLLQDVYKCKSHKEPFKFVIFPTIILLDLMSRGMGFLRLQFLEKRFSGYIFSKIRVTNVRKCNEG